MDINTTFKYWLAVARHTSYKIGKQPRPAFVGGKQVPDNLNQLSIGQLIDLSQLSDSEESLYQIVTTVLGLSHKEVEQARAVDVVMLIGWVTAEVERINKLIREIQRDPFAGIGKPEPLKHALSGFWSRRITDEHRVVYKVEGDALWIAQLRFHY